jgi:site-specific recombinase XerD
MIKNPNYRKFLDEGIIDLLSEEDIKKALVNTAKSRNPVEGRALLLTLYYTGARPVEVLQLMGKNIIKKDNYILIHIKGAKRGLPRTIYLPAKNPLVMEIYNYAERLFPQQLLFYHYRNNYNRHKKNKRGEIKVYIETTSKLGWHFKRWFGGVVPGGVPPYFLRHNRFSKLTKAGVADRDLRQLKGSKTYESIVPYQHMSADSAKKTAKYMD